MKKNTTKKTTINTIFNGFVENTNSTTKKWNEGVNNIYNKMFDSISNYDGKINLRRLLYWTVCGKVDTAIRPVMFSMIDFIATSNGYCMDCSQNMAGFMRMFMTGIKKSQIKNACKVFAQGIALNGDCADFERILTNFYCDMTISERIEAFNEQITNYYVLVEEK